MSDNDSPFDGVFSPIETQMGQDAYQANVQIALSQVRHNDAQTKVAQAIASLQEVKGTVMMTLVLIVFLVALPCMVWLWRWAI